MFSHIPEMRYENFHREFQSNTGTNCELCRGKCEAIKIGSLMPGEAEYIAGKIGRSIHKFRDQYLDGIETPYGIIDILKVKPVCPFLDSGYSCSIKYFKPVLCEIYPVVFAVKHANINFFLDSWCPIVRHVPDLSNHFTEAAIPAIKRISAPLTWYQAIETFDGMCIDYEKLFKLRTHRLDYLIFSLDEIHKGEITDAPPPEFHSSLKHYQPV